MDITNAGTVKNTVQDKLSFIQSSYKAEKFDVVVKECCGLFEVVFKRIYSEAIGSLPYNERVNLIEFEKEIGKSSKGVQEFGFGELVGLFRKSELFKKWAKYTGRDLGLIDSLNYNSIVELRNRLVHDGDNCSQIEADLVFNYLKNMLASLGIVNLEKAITESFEKPVMKKAETDDSGKELANIRLLKDRGIIINEADGSRNISFKVDTINRLFDVMYRKIKESLDEETAYGILWDMGYEGGRSFGKAMNEKWELENSGIDFDTKINKWCEFDSVVGWGKFENNLNINIDEGTIGGQLHIKENYLCFNRRKTDVKICGYIKGYCSGVLEELLDGLPLEVVCKGDCCPQDNPFKKTCEFLVKIQ